MSLVAGEQVNFIISLFTLEVYSISEKTMYTSTCLLQEETHKGGINEKKTELKKKEENIWFLSTYHRHPTAGETKKLGEDG